MLLRVARRRASWEAAATDLETLIKAEFRLKDGSTDLNVSVYQIESNQHVQTFAEHSAGVGLDPPRGSFGVDLQSDRACVPTPGQTGFAFTHEAHRELRFSDEADLRTFLGTVVVPALAPRSAEATKDQLRAYIRERRAADDQEWTTFVAANPKWDTFSRPPP
jgi:hypothetical protein